MTLNGLWPGVLGSQITFTTPTGPAIAIGYSTSPYVTAFQWLPGFGAKHADPLVGVGAYVSTVQFTPSNNAVLLSGAKDGNGVDDRFAVYTWDPGFGTRYGGNLFVAGETIGKSQGASFNPTATVIAESGNYTSRVRAWNFSSATGIGSKFTNPATLPTGGGWDAQFSPTGAFLAVAHNTTPFITVYPWSSGFGTKYANPATLPAGNAFRAAVRTTGNAIAVAHSTTPFITVYPWSSGFGTKYANPATLPPLGGNSAEFSPNGSFLAVTTSASTVPIVYAWSSGFGAKYADPSPLPAGDATVGSRGIGFSPSSAAIAASLFSSPFVVAYAWSSGYGAKYADQTLATLSRGYSVGFTN